MQRLAPIGCTGELMVQRQIARGYRHDTASTEASFLRQVECLPRLASSDIRRYYKTGDMARYNFDGTIEYLGRRDTEVKVRGHRIELGEIEYSLKQCLPDILHAAVDVLQEGSRELLIAFFGFTDEHLSSGRGDNSSPPDNWLLPIGEKQR